MLLLLLRERKSKSMSKRKSKKPLEPSDSALGPTQAETPASITRFLLL
jgi:hypothetical protein